MTPFTYLLLGLFAGVALALLFYEVGRSHGYAEGNSDGAGERDAMATVDLEWVADIPVAHVVTGNPADVAAWIEAVKEGPVIHV